MKSVWPRSDNGFVLTFLVHVVKSDPYFQHTFFWSFLHFLCFALFMPVVCPSYAREFSSVRNCAKFLKLIFVFQAEDLLFAVINQEIEFCRNLLISFLVVEFRRLALLIFAETSFP